MLVRLRPDVITAPSRGPHSRIVDGETVLHVAAVERTQAFGHREIPGRTQKACLIAKVGGLDDEGVALPPADRIA